MHEIELNIYTMLISHCDQPPITKGGGGGTYVMITYVSKENNLGPGDTIRYICGLKDPIFIL